MGDCLTPASWAIVEERREAPFHAVMATEAWRVELFERIAIWEAWIFELGGSVFVEPPRGPLVSLTYTVVLNSSTFLVTFETQAEALDLVVDMRAAGFDVRIDVDRKRRRT